MRRIFVVCIQSAFVEYKTVCFLSNTTETKTRPPSTLNSQSNQFVNKAFGLIVTLRNLFEKSSLFREN